MPKILIIKTTSLGDLIHTMPAISDVQRVLPKAELHWLVEEDFSDIPSWHLFVNKIHTCAIRRWRKSFLSSETRQQIRLLKNTLQAENFDLVIDAQGLAKSAWMVRWLDCDKHGYDKNSIKEKIASHVYTHTYTISRELKAIDRVRQLFASALGYSLGGLEMQFGMQVRKPKDVESIDRQYAIFLHGTNWQSKIWPVEFWQELAARLTAKGLHVFIPWGDEVEHQRAKLIVQGSGAEVLAQQSLNSLAYLLQNAKIVVGSDTGLTHLAAALDSKTIGIYGSTSTRLTGLIGRKVQNLQSNRQCSPCLKRECPLVKEGEIIPCYESVNPDLVFSVIERQLDSL